jgi:FeS assembly SUF system regulator
MRLSRLADYGVLLMSHIARQPERVCTSVSLSEGARLPIPTVSKLLAKLVRAGLLQSIRGRDGGYLLALQPKDITVEAIITAVDGPIALTVCLESGEGACDLEGVCPSQPNWRRINDALRRALSDVSLLDISTPSSFTLSSQDIQSDVGQRLDH